MREGVQPVIRSRKTRWCARARDLLDTGVRLWKRGGKKLAFWSFLGWISRNIKRAQELDRGVKWSCGFCHSSKIWIQFSHSVVSNSLWPHEPLPARPPCPSPTPGVYPNPCLLSQWCHPTLILYRPLLLLPSIFPKIRVFSNESALHIRWPKYWSFSFKSGLDLPKLFNSSKGHHWIEVVIIWTCLFSLSLLAVIFIFSHLNRKELRRDLEDLGAQSPLVRREGH